MAEPHATSALGGQDGVGQLTQPFFLFISPQDCCQDPGLPGCREEGAGARDSVHCGQRCSSCSFPPTPAPATQMEEAVGQEPGRASKHVNS